MSTPITVRDLTKQAPHSPRERAGGFVIASRAVDKCRAVLAGTPGEYHYDCPLDNMLFGFKGITGEQFKTAVQASKVMKTLAPGCRPMARQKPPQKLKPGRMKWKPAAR